MAENANEVVLADGGVKRRIRWDRLELDVKEALLQQLDILESSERPWNASNKAEAWAAFARKLSALTCFEEYGGSLCGKALRAFVEPFLAMSPDEATQMWTLTGGHEDEGGDMEQQESAALLLWSSVAGKYVEDLEATLAKKSQSQAQASVLAAGHAMRGDIASGLGHGGRKSKKRVVARVTGAVDLDGSSDEDAPPKKRVAVASSAMSFDFAAVIEDFTKTKQTEFELRREELAVRRFEAENEKKRQEHEAQEAALRRKREADLHDVLMTILHKQMGEKKE